MWKADGGHNAEATYVYRYGCYSDAHALSILVNNIKRPRLYGFRGLNIMGDRNYINYPRDSSNGMESRFKP